jgi:hypothetical protein
MTPPRTAHVLEGSLSLRVQSTDRKSATDSQLEGHSDFQLVRRSQWSSALFREASDFLDARDTSHPFQWPQWSDERTKLAVLRREGHIQWLALCGVMYPAGRVLRPIRALTLNRGPICDDLEVLEFGLRELVNEAARMRVAYVDIAPEWTGTFAESAAIMLARNGWRALPGVRSSLRLSLSPPLDALLASFRKTTRYEIRRSMSDGIEVTLADDQTKYNDFLRIYCEMARERRFPAEKSDFLINIFRWVAEDRGRGGLFLAREEGKLRGGALVVRSGARCWYILGATSKEGKLGVGHLLQWRAIQWATENGCLEYDFGGFREGVNSGPALFKKGFCDRIVHFLPSHRFVVNLGRHRTGELISGVRRSFQSPSA